MIASSLAFLAESTGIEISLSLISFTFQVLKECQGCYVNNVIEYFLA